jgi:UDP-glucose:glycoprotein glucosyltransferase
VPPSQLVVTAVLDPLSEAAQKIAPLLRTLRDVLGLRVRVVLVPPLEVSELPLKKFYRFVLDADGASGGGLRTAGAHFAGLPRQHTLTLRMEVPEAWNVQVGVRAERERVAP